jgi:lipopolysaccharide export system permease protein
MPVIRQFFYSYLTIIDRYFMREFTLNLLAVTAVLWLIFVATRFSRYLAQAAVGNLPSDVIFILLGYSSLGALPVLLPMSAFLGVMLALSRMSSDNELMVISACGISSRRVIRNVLLFAGTVSLIIATLSLFIVPDVLSNRNTLEQKSKLSADTAGLIAGSFKESRDGSWTFYSEGLSEDNLNMVEVFIEIHRETKPLVFRSSRGRFEIDAETNNKYLVLEDGYRYEGKAGQRDYTITQFETHSILVETGEKEQLAEYLKSLSSSLLWQRGTARDLAELQWRISAAVMTLILCVVALTLANNGPRTGRFAGFLPAILIYIIYSNLLGVTRAWVIKGVMAPWFGLVWVHLVMILLLIVMLNRQKIHFYWLQLRRNRGAV